MVTNSIAVSEMQMKDLFCFWIGVVFMMPGMVCPAVFWAVA
jgi:hypothetical protein